MERKVDVHKAGGILLRDKKLLVEKSFTKDFFLAPGGKLEANESAKQALIRELKEEFSIDVIEGDLEGFGTFYAHSATNNDLFLQMDIFIVKKWN
jgi:8-oxo-dGTP diphosphatase